MLHSSKSLHCDYFTPSQSGAAYTITGHAPRNSTIANLKTPVVGSYGTGSIVAKQFHLQISESLLHESPVTANVSNDETSDLPRGSTTSSDHEIAPTGVSHISAQAHPLWLTFVPSSVALSFTAP